MKTINIGITNFNLVLICLGLILLGAGIYRTVPLKFDKMFWIQVTPLTIFLVLGGYLFLQRMTPQLLIGWGTGPVTAAGTFLPLMVLLALVMALGGVLVVMYSQEVDDSLTNNPSRSTLGAAGVAPTPTVAAKPIEKFWVNPKYFKLRPNFLWFLNAASIASLPLLMLRTAGFGNTEICFKMYLFGLIVALAAYFVRVPVTWMATVTYDSLVFVGHSIRSLVT